MKKLFIRILSLMLCAVTVFGLTACGEGGGGGASGSYTYKRTGAEYLAEAATCTSPAKYYYSNKAGEKNDKTFEMGPAIHDYIDHKCSKCGAEEVYTDGLSYNLHKDGYYVLTGIDTTTEVDIIVPQKHQNKPVKAISAGAFKGTAIKSIKLPEYIVKINNSAFENCTNLASITIPASVDFIAMNAFLGCSKFDKIYFVNPNNWYRNKFETAGKDLDECYKPEEMTGNTAAGDWAKELRKEKTYSFFRAA